MRIPDHTGYKVTDEHTIDYIATRWMVFNAVLTDDEANEAMIDHGFYDIFGREGEMCADIIWWRSTSRTLVIERTYLNI